MSTFEIEGVAKKEVACDIANISIGFKSYGINAYDASRKVMDECDGFLESISKAGIALKDIHFDDDETGEEGYGEHDTMYAERSVKVRIAFDMKTINMIQSILQKGKYDFEFRVNGDVSNMNELRVELAKEALRNSKAEAEQLAEVLGIKIKGVESVRKNSWDDDDLIVEDCECVNVLKGSTLSRASDSIGAKTIELSENLHVKWILE